MERHGKRPAHLPDVGRDDGRHDGAFGRAHVADLRVRRAQGHRAGERDRADLRVRSRANPQRPGRSSVSGRHGAPGGWLERSALLSPDARVRESALRRSALLPCWRASTSSRPGRTPASTTAGRPRASSRRTGGPGPGAFRMGLAHGLYCLGCCWLLMGLLFFGGVMNLIWVAAIAAFILLEKTDHTVPVRSRRGTSSSAPRWSWLVW